jgi:5-(carboxyamino)imidazole ribonucleotide synthase
MKDMLPSIYATYEPRPQTIGILGGGQLAKMLSQDIFKMGMRTAIIEHGDDSPAGLMTKQSWGTGWNDEEALEAFIETSDIITLENEFIDPEILTRIAEKRPVFPLPETIALVQDKFTQKQTMQEAGIAVTPFADCHSVEDAIAFGNQYGYPFIMKTRTLGYDGYGNATIKQASDIQAAWDRFTDPEAPREIMCEAFVYFSKELAVMVARNRRGETAVYPCVETIQEDHICRFVLAPARVEDEIAQKAREMAKVCVEAINGIGVFGIELFLAKDGQVLFNEIAPRPHNSGHYTIEACHTSQFENCIRAILNLPLGSPDLKVPAAVMVNLLGTRTGPGVPDSPVDTLKHPHTTVHLYGKKDCRKGRKMGHLTTCSHTLDEAAKEAYSAASSWIW